MPLTINLLHEEQLLLKQRSRDPLKLGFYALGGVAALFFLFYAYRYSVSSVIASERKSREAEWAKQEPAANTAAAREAELSAQITAAGAVTKRIENRFYWAPVLDLILKTVPPNVQIVNLTGSNEQRADKVTVLFEGFVAGEVPRIAADQFRTLLNERFGHQYTGVTTSFRGLDDTTASVNVNGRPLPTARFTIELDLNKPTGAAVPEPPAPEHHVKHT